MGVCMCGNLSASHVRYNETVAYMCVCVCVSRYKHWMREKKIQQANADGRYRPGESDNTHATSHTPLCIPSAWALHT